MAEDRMRISFLLLAALAAAMPALGQVLTLEEARRLALESQPALRALELGARAADEASVADGALPDPRLKLGALNFPARNFPSARDDMTQIGLSWEQAFPGGDKRRLRTERTRAEAGQARAEAIGLRQGIARDTGQAWIDAWQAAGAERLLVELAQEYERAIELARIALASGKASQADVLAARQLLGQSKDRRLEVVAQARRAKSALARWIPDAASRDLPVELPAFPAPLLPEAIAASLEHHPQHAMHLQAQGVAEADVALAKEASKPDRSVELGYFARSGGRSDMLMFQVAIELPVFADQKQDRMVAAKLAQLERAREQRADHLRQLRSELAAAYADWELAGERLRNVDAAILPDARSRLDALLAQHAAGTVSLNAVFEARRAFVEARIQELLVRAAQAKARIALQYFEHDGGHP
jgi:cobalt-zinc-cadmium efflux system outer membrane protein